MSAKPLTVAGIMSGTSADGIDVAVLAYHAGQTPPESHSACTSSLPISRGIAPQVARRNECLVNVHGRVGAPALAPGPLPTPKP